MNYFFTDKRTSFPKQAFYHLTRSQDMLLHKPWKELGQQLGFNTLLCVDQVHGSEGLVIKTMNEALAYKPYSRKADFMVTNVPCVGLGVATADCLPLIAYDSFKQVIGNAHAGWQGTVKGVAVAMVQTMYSEFGCDYGDIQIIFGPCASVEKYEVSGDFLKEQGLPFEPERVIQQREEKYYFDMVLCNRILLERLGVVNFNYEHNACTMSDDRFCSRRREPESLLRQMSIVVL